MRYVHPSEHRYGRGMVFPPSWGCSPPDGPDTVTCPNCTEDRLAADEPCPHCGHEWEWPDP